SIKPLITTITGISGTGDASSEAAGGVGTVSGVGGSRFGREEMETRVSTLDGRHTRAGAKLLMILPIRIRCSVND
ncbi:hypothetical protein ABTK96_19250, partial [Acinetobacter baumannii]